MLVCDISVLVYSSVLHGFNHSFAYYIMLIIGNDATKLYSDPSLLGAIYVGPYLTHSPEFSFTLDNGSGVPVGYTLGVLDTEAFHRKCRDEMYWNKLYEVCTPLINSYSDNEKKLLHEEVYQRCNDSLHSSPSYLQKYPSHLHIGNHCYICYYIRLYTVLYVIV